MDEKQSKSASRNLIWWVARIWSLPAIFFVIGHLFEPEMEGGVQEDWLTWVTLGLLFVSVFGLVLAWWQARPGAWMAIVALVLSLALYWIDNGEFFPWQGVGLFFVGIIVPAGLFLWSARQA